MSSRICNSRVQPNPLRVSVALLAVGVVLGLSACSRHQNNEGVQNLLGVNTPGLVASGGNVGYIDMDAVVKTHPLHDQLDAMQAQIAVLREESVSVPAGMSPAQSVAYNNMQHELDLAQQKFETDLAQRRAGYERQEAAALSQLQGAVIGQSSAGGVLGGLQQQFGEQAKALQKQAFSTLDSYRNALFKQDADHLRHVQQLLSADVQTKLRQKQNELTAAETKFQIDLAKQDQGQRLNLQTKLQNLALSDKDRSTYQAQLKNIDTRETAMVDSLRTQDNATLAAYQKQLQSAASAKYDAERKTTQQATQQKLMARQREVQTAMAPQMKELGGKFQQQLNDVNQKLATNPKYREQAQTVHNQMQSRYVAEANTVAASYRDTRRALIAKYSAIAHMQFQDNAAIAAQMDKVASDRRDLLQKILDQVRVAAQQVAQQDGIAVVFQSIRGGGTAVDLTQQVTKAIAQSATAAPTSSPGGP